MTGKDLIIFILDNDLVNVDINTIINCYLRNEEQVAADLKVGPAVIRTMVKLGKLNSVLSIDGKYYFSSDRNNRVKENKS